MAAGVADGEQHQDEAAADAGGEAEEHDPFRLGPLHEAQGAGNEDAQVQGFGWC